MRETFQVGSTSNSVYFRAWTAADGLPKTDIVYNTSGFTCHYVRYRAAASSITLATLASASAAWATGGFIVVQGNLYRLDVPDAAFVTGVPCGQILPALTGVVFEPCGYDLTVDDPRATAGAAQTGDTYARLGAPQGGSISADITALPAVSADKLLGRRMDGGADGGRTVYQALAATGRNKVVVDRAAGTITVYGLDDSTVLWSGTIALEASGYAPLKTIDPA